MADVQVEVAVAVEVGERGGGRPVAVAAEAGGVRGVLEGAVAAVAVKGVGPPAGDEQVGVAVVVDVADGDAVAISAGEGGDPGGFGGVLEGAVAAIVEEAVAVGGPARAGRERASLGGVDVEPAVAVVVEQAQARAHRLGDLSLLAGAGIVAEAEADGLGVVGEGRGGSGRGGGRPGAGRVGGGAEVGEDLGAGRGASAVGLGPRQPLQGRLPPRPRHEAAAGREFPPGTGLEQAAQRLGVAG